MPVVAMTINGSNLYFTNGFASTISRINDAGTGETNDARIQYICYCYYVILLDMSVVVVVVSLTAINQQSAE